MDKHDQSITEDSFENLSDSEGLEKYKSSGFHPVYLDERFKQGAYRVVRKLGHGHFSTVWLVEKRDGGKPNRLFALKVIRADSCDYGYAVHEEKLYRSIDKNYESDAWRSKLGVYQKRFALPPNFGTGCVRLRDTFDHHGMFGKHFCFVFDVVGPNLLDLVVHYYDDLKRKIPISVVKQITRQLLVALDLLHDNCGIIHTDLKLENIGIAISDETVSKVAAGKAVKPISMKFLKLLTQSKKSKNAKKKRAKAKANEQPDLQSEAQTQINTEVADLAEELKDLQLEPSSEQTQSIDDSSHPKAQPNETEEPEDYLVWKDQKIDVSKSITVQILDLGNAVHVSEKLPSKIQTKEYRCPETILGTKYNQTADIWSVACLVFELLTGEYLFEPKTHTKVNVTEDDDHLAIMMSTLGEMPKSFALSGKNSLEFFTKAGKFKAKNALQLNTFGIKDILMEDFDFEEQDAEDVENFLLPMLCYDPAERATASQVLESSWLQLN